MTKTPIVILGLFDTGLYVAQSVAKYNIPVYGFDYNLKNPGFFSRYIFSFQTAHPFDEPKKLLSQLIAKAKELPAKSILIPSSEDYLSFIAKNREELLLWYNFVIPEPEIIANILSKEGQFEMAIKSNLLVPDYYCINSLSDLTHYLNNYDNSTIIIKAKDQAIWKAKVNKKAFILSNYDDIQQTGHSLIEQRIAFIIQKIIDGECTNNYEFNALMLNGRIIESCVIQKIRQYPPGYGAACCIQTVNNTEIDELGRKFVTQNKIEGFSNTEFKLNMLNGKYYFIETNTRVWQQIRLTEYIGQNFIISYYNSLASENIQLKIKRNEIGIKWVDTFSDTLLWFRYLRKKDLGFGGYLMSLNKTKNFGLFNLKDMSPFLHEVKGMNIFNFKKK